MLAVGDDLEVMGVDGRVKAVVVVAAAAVRTAADMHFIFYLFCIMLCVLARNNGHLCQLYLSLQLTYMYQTNGLKIEEPLSAAKKRCWRTKSVSIAQQERERKIVAGRSVVVRRIDEDR